MNQFGINWLNTLDHRFGSKHCRDDIVRDYQKGLPETSEVNKKVI